MLELLEMNEYEYFDSNNQGREQERERIIELLEQEIEKQSSIENYNYTAKKVLEVLKNEQN
jgi:hypothetical protein